MLRIEETSARTYEERMTDAVSMIPLFTSEWTDHNPSDPGITILENLILFETLQGSRITEVNDETRGALLKMAGFTPLRGKCARMLLSAGNMGRRHLTANQRFSLGELHFETKKAMDVGGCHILAVYSFHDGKYHDISALKDRSVNVPVKVFGDAPKVGDGLYFICDMLPGAGEETSFYFTVDQTAGRNPLLDRSDNIFSSFKWEYYTPEGFKELKVRDYTGALLSSGEVKIKFTNDDHEIYSGFDVKGFCIKASLKKSDYDVKPKLMGVDAFLFEVWQKNTMAYAMTIQHADRIHVKSPIMEEGYALVFAREEKGGSYKRYELCLTKNENGRYCLYEKGREGSFSLTFDKRIFGFEPAKVKDTVRLVLYSNEVMRRYHVGQVLGYDDQEIEIPFRHIVPDTFSLIAKRTDDKGEDYYDFVRPGVTGEGALSYRLYEDTGRIVIEDAGDFIGAELYIGGLATTDGPKGNVRAGNRFIPYGMDGDFYNPGPGTGGAFREKIEDVAKRFRDDVYTPCSCVTESDYEQVVSKTPGLCIRKVRAVMDELQNIVHIPVMPGTDEQFPRLSKEYTNAISKNLSEKRLITTRFKILPPVYVGVSVRGTVYVRRHFNDCRKRIEDRIRQTVNYMDSDKNFGEPLTFEELFSAIEDLDCVEYVYELFMRPDNLKAALHKDSSIYPGMNTLLYPGRIDIEIITYENNT